MTIGAGIGIANFTFEDGNGFWEWVSLCDNGGDMVWRHGAATSSLGLYSSGTFVFVNM